MGTEKCTFEIKINNITYYVGLKSSETAKETFEAIIRKTVVKEALTLENKPNLAVAG